MRYTTKPVLVAGGDSFVFGTELHDQVKGIYSKHTFPALLSQQAGLNYACVAVPGASNSEIARHVVNYCETHKDLQLSVLVSWTFANRYEFNFVNEGWQSINVWNLQGVEEITRQLKTFSQKTIDDQIKTNSNLKLAGNYKFIDEFYKRVATTEFWEIYTSLKEIVYLQNYLEINRIPYLFTFADNSLLFNSTIDKKEVDIESLYRQIKLDNFFMFKGDASLDGKHFKGFYQWALENKYPIGATHPLETAHTDAAILMRDKFNEMVEKLS